MKSTAREATLKVVERNYFLFVCFSMATKCRVGPLVNKNFEDIRRRRR